MASHNNNNNNYNFNFNIDPLNAPPLSLLEQSEPLPKRRIILPFFIVGLMLSFAIITTITTLLVVGKEQQPEGREMNSLEVVPSFPSVATSPGVVMFGLSALQQQTSCFVSSRSPFLSL